MNNNRFVRGYPGAGTARHALLFDNRRLADIPLPLGPNLGESTSERGIAPVRGNQVKSGWNIKRRNLGGADIAYEMPSTYVDGLVLRAPVLGVGANATEVKKGNITKYNAKTGVNLSAADLKYHKAFDNGSIKAAVNGPGVELGFNATSTERKYGRFSVPTGWAGEAKAKATVLTGEADGSIELPLRKTFNAPPWKILANIIGALRGERKARPGDLKLVLSGGGEGGAALGANAFLRVGEYSEGMTPGMSHETGAKVRHGFGVKVGGALYPFTGWGLGARAGIAIEQEPEETGLASPVASGTGNGSRKSEAAGLLFDPRPYGPEQAFTPIDEPIEDISHFSRSRAKAGGSYFPTEAARLLFDPRPHGPAQMFTPIDESDEDTSRFSGASANPPVVQPRYVLPRREADGAGGESSPPDRLKQLKRAFWLLSPDNGR